LLSFELHEHSISAHISEISDHFVQIALDSRSGVDHSGPEAAVFDWSFGNGAARAFDVELVKSDTGLVAEVSVG
jgi:hypothetical protein